jgi:hypothetical protein
MQEKIELSRVRAFSEIIEDSIQFYKQTWKPLLTSYLAICGFFCAAGLLVGLVNEHAVLSRAADGESPFTFTYFLAMVFELFNYMIITLTVLCFMSLYKEKGNEPPMVVEVWSYFKYYFFRIFTSWVALGALIAAGTVCCILPGIYFAVVLSITFPIMIMENATLSYSFNRSFQLIKANWWLTLGIILVTILIVVAAMFAIVIPVMLVTWASTFLTLINAASVYSYTSIIVTHLLQFLYILPVIGVTLTYFSLNEAKDDGTLLQRIMLIGKTAPGTIDPLTEEY